MKPSEAVSQLESLNKEVSIYSDAIELAISALRAQEQDGDLISRQMAIYAMGKAQWAKERLMELPSAQPERTCDTCRYNHLEWYDEPCDSCTMGGTTNHYKPFAEPERKMGKWIDAVLPNDNGGLRLPVQVCDQCNTFFSLAYTGGGHNFCPQCGADMRETGDMRGEQE